MARLFSSMLCLLMLCHAAFAQRGRPEIPEVVIEISASPYFRPALHFAWPAAQGEENRLRERLRRGLVYSAALTILDSVAVDTTATPASPAPEGQWGAITVLEGGLRADSTGRRAWIGLRDLGDSLHYARFEKTLGARPEATADSLCHEVLQLLTGRPSLVFSRIVFVRSESEGRNLFATSLFGDPLRRLTSTPSTKVSPSLSPDGGELVYGAVREQSGADLFLLPLHSGGRAVPLVEHPESDAAAAWSPDGQWIACASTRQGNTDLYLVPAGDKAFERRERRLTFDRGIDTSPSWSPDSRHLVYCSDRAGGLQIYRCTVDGLEHRRISWFGYSNDCPSWSPDGEWIAFVTRERKGYQLCIMRPDGSDARRLTSAPGNHFDPCWSPDGSQLVYSREGRLWIIFIDGGGERQLLAGEGHSPQWVAELP